MATFLEASFMIEKKKVDIPINHYNVSHGHFAYGLSCVRMIARE